MKGDWLDYLSMCAVSDLDMRYRLKCWYCGKVLKETEGQTMDVADQSNHECFKKPNQSPKYLYGPVEKYGEQG